MHAAGEGHIWGSGLGWVLRGGRRSSPKDLARGLQQGLQHDRFNRKAHALCYVLLTPSLTVRRMNGQCEDVRKGRDIPCQAALHRAS